MKETILEITLLLISLTSWQEEKRHSSHKKSQDNEVEMVTKAWKGYTFDVVNTLERQGWIRPIPGGKSLFLTDKGKERAEALKAKYFNERSEGAGEE
jgi:hypothetical protein